MENITLTLSLEELGWLHNALNIVCNASNVINSKGELTDSEFSALMGATKDEGQALLAKTHRILEKYKGG